MTDLYTQVDINKRKTLLIIFGFIVFITALSWMLSYIYDLSALSIIAFGFIFSGISSFVSYYKSDAIVLKATGAKPAPQEVYPDLYNLVENMSIASGLPKPKIYIIEDHALNAFATGRDPEHSAVCFTTGIIKSLEKRELEGVIAHEMSHIGNYDIRLMSIVSVLVGTVLLVADFTTRGLLRSGRNKKGSGLVAIIGIIFIILSPVIATIIKFAVSRNREYLADSTAALTTRYPQGLADALKKISQSDIQLKKVSGSNAHMFISNPFKQNVSGGMQKLFSTHPPVEERIKRLENM